MCGLRLSFQPENLQHGQGSRVCFATVPHEGSYTAQGLHCAAPESEYILFLDDDVAIYPNTIQTLLDMLSSDPALLMVTGWPYDVMPLSNMPIACLCRIVYRWFSMFPLTKQRVP